MVFLQCMAGLFDPVHRRGEPVKWGLVSYTVVMFSIITMITVMNFVIQSISYVDNRKFPGVEDLVPAGPTGTCVLFYPLRSILSPTRCPS